MSLAALRLVQRLLRLGLRLMLLPERLPGFIFLAAALTEIASVSAQLGFGLTKLLDFGLWRDWFTVSQRRDGRFRFG